MRIWQYVDKEFVKYMRSDRLIERLREVDWDKWTLITEDGYNGKRIANTPEEAVKLLLPPKVILGNSWEQQITWVAK